jgi:hypothetical protein
VTCLHGDSTGEVGDSAADGAHAVWGDYADLDCGAVCLCGGAVCRAGRNKGLYITGGVCLVAAMALKQLGQVKGARKRLGQ